jgi:hypothetical protein
MKTFIITFKYFGRTERTIIKASTRQNALEIFRIEYPGATLISVEED